MHADELRFKQVVLNLASNAVKFTRTAGRSDPGGRTADELVVTVTDTGVGIPPEDRERIFESFQQGGRGALARRAPVSASPCPAASSSCFDGRLWLDSEDGVGSTFGFSLPPPGQCAAAAVTRARPPDPALVDDDRASLDLVAAYLEGAPLHLERAHDGEEALALDRGSAPGSGRAGHPPSEARRLAGAPADARRPDTSACRSSWSSVVDERARGLEQGATDYLIKPVSRDALVGALARAGRADESAAHGGSDMTGERILVVEDNPLNLKLVRDVLECGRLRRPGGDVR